MKILLVLAVLVLCYRGLKTVTPLCKACHTIVSIVQHSAPERFPVRVAQKLSTMYCTKKALQVKKVCQEAVQEMTQFIVNSAWRHYSDPHSVCHRIYMCPKEYFKRDLNKDMAQILKDKPKGKAWEIPKRQKVLRILHITDLHPDMFYTVGAPAKCSEPVCCRSNVTVSSQQIMTVFQKLQNGQVKESQQPTDSPAGYWGSIASCDLPIQTFNLFLKQLQKMELDLIIWTGDNTPHDVWQQTQQYNVNFTTILAQKLRQHTNATIIPAMGNHQSWPVNVYDFQGDRQSLLNAALAEAWRPWLTEEAFTMLREKGYYSMAFPHLNNLKIIAMNTQAGNDMNWFLLRDPTDPGHMLKWVQEELRQSERLNQHVYIIGHISSKSSLNDWAMRFNALVDRFSYIIRGQFYGHSHTDHFSFYPDFSDSEKISGYFLLPGSITTYSNKNPMYRIMDVDYQTSLVLDYHQYMLHLEKNPKKQDKPSFQHFYSFLEAYGIRDMMLDGGLAQLRRKMRDDPQTQKKYTYFMDSGLRPGHAGRNVYCDTMTSPQLQQECMVKSLKGKASKKDLFNRVAGPWKDLHHNQ